MVLMRRLKSKLNSLQNKNRLLLETSEEPMRRYDEQKTLVGWSVRSLVKRVATRIVGMAKGISRALSIWYLIEIYELDYFIGHLPWN